jgi:hypothetical protein
MTIHQLSRCGGARKDGCDILPWRLREGGPSSSKEPPNGPDMVSRARPAGAIIDQ